MTSDSEEAGAARSKKDKPEPGAGFFDSGRAKRRGMRGSVLKYVTSNPEEAGAARIKKDKPEGGCGIRYLLYLLLPVLVVVIIAGYIGFLLSPVTPPGKYRETMLVIPPQATAADVGDLLEQQNLVRSGKAFTYWARLNGKDGELKAGSYRLPDGFSVPQLLEQLISGRFELQKFTIPEGYTTAQIADLLEEKGLADRERFYQLLVNDDYPYDFLEKLPNNEKRLEGYLFPDTYQIVRGVDESAIIKMMLDRFAEEVADKTFPVLVEGREMSLHQIVTVASMVEREALYDSDMPLISGVIYNRLRINMRLQIDATVQYALGTVKPRLLYSDLEVDSPYNTYKYSGLPPGPISMPGSKALQAAMQPVTDGGYYYYLAMPNGYHVFSRTLDEHNHNKARYIQ